MSDLNANQEPRMASCALSKGQVALMQFARKESDPRFVTILAPADARKLADELIRAAGVAEK